MDDQWYYVYEGQRKGPISHEQLLEMCASQKLGNNDYIWKKGYDKWMKVKDVSEITQGKQTTLKFQAIADGQKVIYIKIGADRGAKEVEYGPFDKSIIKKLYLEKRINEKTYIFTASFKDWVMMGEMTDLESFLGTSQVSQVEKRESLRKPFVARMFFADHSKIYEGICRDISIGGMQVLVDYYPGKSGDVISINVHPENTDHHFVAQGEIVRMLEGNQGFSFRFINLSNEAKEAINKYLGQ